MNQYKVWYLASEVSPFAKTGGLGDVTGSFPKALKAKQRLLDILKDFDITDDGLLNQVMNTQIEKK